jgi:hypothetical protein
VVSQTLLLPVLRIVAQGETRADDFEEQIANEFNLTAEEPINLSRAAEKGY